VKFLLVNNHCITDSTAGLTHSLLTIMQWLSQGGHDCHVLTTARFENPVDFTIEEHLRTRGIEPPLPPPNDDGVATEAAVGRPVVQYAAGSVAITLLMTRHNDERHPDVAEARQFLDLFDDLMEDFRPDQVIACNGHAMIRAALARAHARGVTTAFAVRGYGYYDAGWFEHVHHVFTCSDYLTRFYRDRIGLVSTPLEPPIDWSTVVAPLESRAFVTFVHPALHKGLMLFARLALMLGERRPDIPVLVVQSGRSAGYLNAIPGVDFTKYPQIMAVPGVPTPADYFALTRVLLVPSVWPEPFGRVAAEAMINGIPPIVSDRGALPEVVRSGGAEDGGRVVPLPSWMEPDRFDLPAVQEVEPWFDAICQLWDDADAYAAVAARGRQIAEERYSERVSRARHIDYFTRLKPAGAPFVT
jgi:glycosyltransferase involved in cell wall biosynthesis